MRYNIIGIVICMLLISSTTTLALTPFRRDKEQTMDQLFETTPVPLPPSNTWMKTFGGTGSEMGYSVQQTIDGGYILTGFTDSYGAGQIDIWLIKTDGNGNKLWDKTFGDSWVDYGNYVQQTIDGGYIIIGTHNQNETWLIKTDSSGNKEWDKIFKVYGGMDTKVQQTTDGGYIITGIYGLIKIDDSGNTEWIKTSEFGESITSAQQTTDGGYILAGGYSSGGYNSSVWLCKTDDNGNKVWDKTFQIINGFELWRYPSVKQTIDGGYILKWLIFSYDTGSDIFLMKTDSSGNKIWDKIFRGSGTSMDWAESIQPTADGGYVLIGCIGATATNPLTDVWLMKTDGNGNKLWDGTFGGPLYDYGQSGQQTTDGGYIIVGTKNIVTGQGYGDIWLIKTDSEGKAKTLSSGNLWFERLFQWFPNAFPILRQLLGY